MSAVEVLTAADLSGLMTMPELVGALHDALRSGRVDPEHDDPRLFSPAPGGEFLLMPSRGTGYSGVKLLTVAPDNPARGKPKIQGVYVLFDSDGLTPRAMLDGPELTLLRTPAVTALAVRELLAIGPAGSAGPAVSPVPLVVYGTGPQALRHVLALRAILGPVEAAVIGRRREAVDALVAEVAAAGVGVRAGTPDDLPDAAVVVCATSSSTPVLDDALIGPDTVVAAVGAHGPDRAELPPALVQRADIVVEGRDSAMRESGNLLGARSREEWAASPPANLADLVSGRITRRPGAPAVYSGVGMSWEDLVIATALYDTHRLATSRP